jgi:hypothetical protein
MGLNTSLQQFVERLNDLNRYLLYFPKENPKQLDQDGYQVLNLTEGHHPLDPVLWDPTSILEDSKVSGVLGASSWVVWIHEKLQLDPLRLVRISPINLVHLLHLGNKRNGGGVLAHRRRQRGGGFGKLTHGHCLD